MAIKESPSKLIGRAFFMPFNRALKESVLSGVYKTVVYVECARLHLFNFRGKLLICLRVIFDPFPVLGASEHANTDITPQFEFVVIY